MFRLPSRRHSRPSSLQATSGVGLFVVPGVALALAAAPVVVGAGPSLGLPEASAHDVMVGSTPEQDSTISDAPDAIELEFSGIPRDDFNTVALSRDGEVLVTDEPTIDGHSLTLDVPDDVEMSDGEYTVGYQITSSDGHATRGSYVFTLAADGGAAESETSQGAGEADDDAGMPSWAGPALGIAGVIVVLGALVVAIARFRSMSSDESGEPGADDRRDS
ncbi:Putative membrane protein [Corynebacterium glyciniphilum AJ 3170]|uniref:Putative membrane protein n=1 Tax=Corynebacterium glyciniphilum AJ 3170 TaxID=1404245 RepID=X5DLR9_9CORY|nr:copper resistance CopC family protein [Corynebacterium glyciniphilum]AHW64063.1 Putative membrane protein [Corynebacterium glyciniphilum AJ 3170]